VVVVPGELDGVLADAFGGDGLRGGLEHGQRSRSGFRGCPGFASRFFTLFVAHRAGAGVAEVDEGIVGSVAIGPLDVDTRAGSKIHFY